MTREQVDSFIAFAHVDRPQLLALFGDMFFAQPVSPSFREWFQSSGLKAAGFSTIKALELLRGADLRPDLPKVRVPTGIFHGVLDMVCDYSLALALNEGISGSVLYTFEQSGHAAYYDELGLFNQTLLRFLEPGA